MEKIAHFESFIKDIKNEQVNEISDDLINLLNELSELDTKCKYTKNNFYFYLIEYQIY